MIYINSHIDRKGQIKLRIKRNGKDIVIKNIWVKKHDNILIEQIHRNDKNKGEYFTRERKRAAYKKLKKKDRYAKLKYTFAD
jgi:hypothetical protein